MSDAHFSQQLAIKMNIKLLPLCFAAFFFLCLQASAFTIKGITYADRNENAKVDPEEFLSGVTVTRVDNNEQTTSSESTGLYTFEVSQADTYKIKAEIADYETQNIICEVTGTDAVQWCSINMLKVASAPDSGIVIDSGITESDSGNISMPTDAGQTGNINPKIVRLPYEAEAGSTNGCASNNSSSSLSLLLLGIFFFIQKKKKT